MRWVDLPKVRLMRQRFVLPAKSELGAVRDHPFGAARVTVGTVFDRVARLHAVANGFVAEDDENWQAANAERQPPSNPPKRAKTYDHDVHADGTAGASSSGPAAATGALAALQAAAVQEGPVGEDQVARKMRCAAQQSQQTCCERVGA